MQPDFIYFDIDDTLLDHMHAQQNALSDAYNHYEALQAAGLEDFQNTYKEINSRLWLEYSIGRIDRPELSLRRFQDSFTRLGIEIEDSTEVAGFYMNAYRKHWSWLPGAKEALDEICEHYPVGFITNGFAETQKLKVNDFRLKEYSDQVIISEEVGFLKPHPKIFRYAEEKAGISADKILYVGDSYSSDVKGGKAAGWQVAWFTKESDAERLSKADFNFDDFSELRAKLNGK